MCYSCRTNFVGVMALDIDQVLILYVYIPYNGYFLWLEIFAIWAPKRSILIFAFLIFVIPFNRKK